MSAPITDEEARELAARWAWWHRHATECAPLDLVGMEKWLVENGPAGRVLHEPDRERLYAWARARMAPNTHRRRAQVIAVSVPLKMTFDDAWALCEAAGWPS